MGSGRPRLISIAGQMMEWKRTISLPTMCTSAGQYFSKSEYFSLQQPRAVI